MYLEQDEQNENQTKTQNKLNQEHMQLKLKRKVANRWWNCTLFTQINGSKLHIADQNCFVCTFCLYQISLSLDFFLPFNSQRY